MADQRKGPIAGIDPGLTGAIAFVGKDGSSSVHDMPIIRVHSKGYVDGYALRSLLVEHAPRLIVIELAGARQMQGVKSITQTWLVYGGIVTLCLSLDCPVEIVAPAKWKRALGLLGTDKEASRAKALKLYPKLDHMLKRKKDHNRAEAVLLAKWGSSLS